MLLIRVPGHTLVGAEESRRRGDMRIQSGDRNGVLRGRMKLLRTDSQNVALFLHRFSGKKLLRTDCRKKKYK